MTADAEIIAERAAQQLDQWPTLEQAVGCMNCLKITRTASPGCLFCGSESLLNVAEILSGRELGLMKDDTLCELLGAVQRELVRRGGSA